jgi:hypothetical protein
MYNDGLTLSFSDDEFHPFDEEWLRTTARKNDLNSTWFAKESVNATGKQSISAHLEVDDLTVEYF